MGGRSSVVEHQLPKLSVEGSIPFARSILEFPQNQYVGAKSGPGARRMANFETELVQQGRLLAPLVDGQSHTRGRIAEFE
jgi:hypothetical protein